MSGTVDEKMGETVDEKRGNTHPLTNSSTYPLENPIIQVKHLSKRYQIGMDRTYKTFCESVTDTIKSPLKRLKSFSRQETVFWALKDINFEVYPGEVVGIIGRNGAGKSTLLKILSRITHPTEGEIRLRGRVASLLEVGTGFHPELTGRENIYFNGSILGMTKQEIEDKFDEIVEFSGVADFLDTPLKRYSSGMSVRLAFAVAAHLDPEILVVDEVLAVGDAEFQKKCLDKMKDVSEGGRTVLFVSHNMTSIRQLCNRCLLLEDGKVSLDGDANTTIDFYLGSSALQFSGELTKEMHKISDGARFTQVRILRGDGQPVAAPKNFTPLEIQIDLELDEFEITPMITMGIDTIEGTPLTRISTDNNWLAQDGLHPGRNRLCLQVELPFSPGLYVLILRADHPFSRSKPLAVVGTAMTFELQESRDLGFDGAAKPYRNGFVPLDGKWHAERFSTAEDGLHPIQEEE
jgi:lipopolysaccharide transport system ATP-binding protein